MIAVSPATYCGPSCSRSCGGAEGSSWPSGISCLVDWASTTTILRQETSAVNTLSRVSGLVQPLFQFARKSGQSAAFRQIRNLTIARSSNPVSGLGIVHGRRLYLEAEYCALEHSDDAESPPAGR